MSKVRVNDQNSQVPWSTLFEVVTYYCCRHYFDTYRSVKIKAILPCHLNTEFEWFWQKNSIENLWNFIFIASTYSYTLLSRLSAKVNKYQKICHRRYFGRKINVDRIECTWTLKDCINDWNHWKRRYFKRFLGFIWWT